MHRTYACLGLDCGDHQILVEDFIQGSLSGNRLMESLGLDDTQGLSLPDSERVFERLMKTLLVCQFSEHC